MHEIVPVVEDFDGHELDPARWVPHYLPHWSSRDASRATAEVSGSILRLTIPRDQGLWCPDRHSPALRTSTIASGLRSGPAGTTDGQQPFRDGLTVFEEQAEFRGWLLGHGTLRVRARLALSRRSMASVWLTGFEDAPERSGEVCVFEIFGDTVRRGASPSAGVGAGVHPFRDPALTDDFTVTPAPIDVGEWHEYEVTIAPSGCEWRVDGEVLRRSAQVPAYPLQIFVGVFDFPEREDGSTEGHVPALEVDRIAFTPAG